MTFEEYWLSEYPPFYEVGKAVARAAWEAARLDVDQLRAALARRRPASRYTGNGWAGNGR